MPTSRDRFQLVASALLGEDFEVPETPVGPGVRATHLLCVVTQKLRNRHTAESTTHSTIFAPRTNKHGRESSPSTGRVPMRLQARVRVHTS